MNGDWKDFFKEIRVNKEQKTKILKGRSESIDGKIKLNNIFGRVPDSVWPVKQEQKIDMSDRTQDKVSSGHRNDTLNIYDNSTRNKNVRWKGALSIFPISILNQLLDFYTVPGETFFDPFAGHNSRMEASFKKARHYIGYDVSKVFMEFNREVAGNLLKHNPNNISITLKEQDSRTIDDEDNSVDFIFSSPPYWSLEWYGDEPEQLGKLSYEDFMKDMTDIYKHCYRILKPGKFCLINVNDFRLDGKYYSYHTDTINALKEAGFTQYDMIIMKYGNAMRKSFPNQILKEKLMPKIHEYIIVMYKAPEQPHSAVFPFNIKEK